MLSTSHRVASRSHIPPDERPHRIKETDSYLAGLDATDSGGSEHMASADKSKTAGPHGVDDTHEEEKGLRPAGIELVGACPRPDSVLGKLRTSSAPNTQVQLASEALSCDSTGSQNETPIEYFSGFFSNSFKRTGSYRNEGSSGRCGSFKREGSFRDSFKREGSFKFKKSFTRLCEAAMTEDAEAAVQEPVNKSRSAANRQHTPVCLKCSQQTARGRG